MSTSDQQPPIPDKLYFKIGEVCEITGIKQHVLRYWESEFPILSPQRAKSRQRLYRRSDVENILRIKRLLKEEGMTISGAKKLLARQQRPGAGKQRQKGGGSPDRENNGDKTGDQPADSPSGQDPGPVFSEIKEELLNLKKILER